MASKKVSRYENVFQSTSKTITLSKNADYTQDSTSGLALTAYLVDEDSADTGSGAVNVTVGSPTGSAADTDVTFQIDTSTGITITARKWMELIVVDENGRNLIPNKVTGRRVMLELVPQPGA